MDKCGDPSTEKKRVKSSSFEVSFYTKELLNQKHVPEVYYDFQSLESILNIPWVYANFVS